MDKKIETIELKFLTLTDYEALKKATLQSYGGLPNSYWKIEEIGTLLSLFPEGQIVIVADGNIAGCALSIIVDYDNYWWVEKPKAIVINNDQLVPPLKRKPTILEKLMSH